jgi:hypothetical protein
VNADVGFGQHRHTGDTPVGCKMMQVKVQQGSAAFYHAFAQCTLHKLQIVESFGAPEIDNQMGAGKLDTVSFNKMVSGCGELRMVLVFWPDFPTGSWILGTNNLKSRSSLSFHPSGPPFVHNMAVGLKSRQNGRKIEKLRGFNLRIEKVQVFFNYQSTR